MEQNLGGSRWGDVNQNRLSKSGDLYSMEEERWKLSKRIVVYVSTVVV
jgi:hypothetical protein